MAQKRIMIDDKEIWQPDEDLQWDYETTYTEDSTRVQSGAGHFTELFTTQSFAYEASNVPKSEGTKLLKLIVGRKFNLTCYSPYFGEWRKTKCYVGKGSLKIKTLKENKERYESISFNMVGVNPIKVGGS